MYSIRSFAVIDWSNPLYYSDNPPSIIFGLILPVVSFSLIFAGIFIRNKFIRYPFDVIDFLLILLTIILLVFSIFSPDIDNSIEYFAKFLVLGLSFYVVGKICIFNADNPMNIIKEIFLGFYFLGILLSLSAFVILYFNNLTIGRLTLPGCNPIPFAQSVGITFVLSFILFITDGEILKIKRKSFLVFNLIVLIFITFSLFATNTRGILLASVASTLFFILLNPIKIKRKIIFLLFVLLTGIIFLVVIIDIKFLFVSLLQLLSGESINIRLLAYNDAIQIFSEHIFGIGTNGYSHYSFLDYPHNLFLQNIAEYGIFGLIWNCLFVALMGYILYIIFRFRSVMPVFILFYVLFIYYFIETMFSFTLWMHKGLYFSLGILSYVLFLYEKKSSKK